MIYTSYTDNTPHHQTPLDTFFIYHWAYYETSRRALSKNEMLVRKQFSLYVYAIQFDLKEC